MIMKKYRYEFPPLEPHFVESPTSDAIVKYVKRTYPHNYDEVAPKPKDVEENDHLRNGQPPITGQAIMETFAIPPGRIVGEIKEAIREAILDGNLANEYHAAHAFMIELGKQHGLTPR